MHPRDFNDIRVVGDDILFRGVVVGHIHDSTVESDNFRFLLRNAENVEEFFRETTEDFINKHCGNCDLSQEQSGDWICLLREDKVQ